MIYSMTGFGRSQKTGDWGMATWEIRSINHRYLEICVRLPDTLREIEQPVREVIQEFFKRGKIECILRFHPGPKLGSLLSVNRNLLDQLITTALDIQKSIPGDIARINVNELLTWNGVVIEQNIDMSLIHDELLNLFQKAAKNLKEARHREGKILAETIKEKMSRIEEEVAKIQKKQDKLVTRQRERIMERLDEAKVNLDLQRLEQEMVYFAQKTDITEELDRIASHLTEVSHILKRGDSAGRRLDFMMQEFNREANTLASKSADTVVTHGAVEMKVLIEQIREQVQNIE